jgi:hypothetical protein
MNANKQIADMLRKLAVSIREAGKEQDNTKLQKCAQAAQAATALGLFARKLGVACTN